jgi:hypothetical protein
MKKCNDESKVCNPLTGRCVKIGNKVLGKKTLLKRKLSPEKTSPKIESYLKKDFTQGKNIFGKKVH